MSTLEMLQTAQFVIGRDGHPSAVQISIEAWEALLDWIEQIEDRVLIKQMARKLRRGPQAAGALRWVDVRDEWEDIETEDAL